MTIERGAEGRATATSLAVIERADESAWPKVNAFITRRNAIAKDPPMVAGSTRERRRGACAASGVGVAADVVVDAGEIAAADVPETSSGVAAGTD